MNRREFLSGACAGGVAWALGSGWVDAAPPRGKETRLEALILGEERSRQPDIWALEVYFKPMRLIAVDLPDLRTGKATRQLIRYLCYRVVRRPSGSLTPEPDLSADKAVFVPEFLLMTYDNGQQKLYYDRVMPVAQAAINKRERSIYKNSVEIVGPLPPTTPLGATAVQSWNGVAMWRGVDPAADRFRVLMSGFSNGYQSTKDPNGQEMVQRKTIVQEYWRKGDEFDQDEDEIQQVNDPKWVYV